MSRFVPVHETIDLALLGNDDYLKRAKGRLLTWAKYVYEDMQISVIKQPTREEFQIDKRKNTINLPCNAFDLCSVSVRDHHGVLWPCYQNQRLNEMVVIPADKDCNCEHNCGFQLCNTIKGYEAIVSTKSDFNPDMTPVSFQCVDKMACDGNGFIYKQSQYPLRQYTNSVWTSTILYTENTKMCQCEVDANGCICDTPQNVDLVCSACGVSPNSIPVGGNANCPPSPSDTKWLYYCSSKLDFFMIQCGGRPRFRDGFDNIYNVSELGNQLQFPHHFAFDKAVIRYYGVPSLKNMVIPFIAVDTFVSGLKWFDVRWNDKKQALEPKFGADYSRLKWGLFETFNKRTLADTGQMLAPHRFMPSYLRPRHEGFDRE